MDSHTGAVEPSLPAEVSAAGRIRVSDAEREAVVARLSDATSEGRLNLEEFGERASRALAARTRGELDLVVDDLPTGTSLVPRSGTGAVSPDRPLSHVVAIGGVKRRGYWRIDRDIELGTVLGTVKLDLRQAEIAAPEVRIQVETVLGTVKVWVPHGITVVVDGDTVIGTRTIVEDRPVPGAPVLRLTANTVIGTVKVFRV